jgi:hypothetical protein
VHDDEEGLVFAASESKRDNTIQSSVVKNCMHGVSIMVSACMLCCDILREFTGFRELDLRAFS